MERCFRSNVGYRENFPQLAEGLIYLDSAATTLKPQCVIDTLTQFYTHEYATIHRSVYDSAQSAGEKYYQTRLRAQAFLHASYPEEIIFTRGTTHSLNVLARSFSKSFLTPSKCVVISEIEHHSNIVPWQMAAEEIGFSLLFVRVDKNGQIDISHLAELLANNRVQLVSVAHVSNITGTVQPVKQITAMAHAAGAYVAIDGAQAVGHISIDVQTLDVDFYVFSSHKIYGPTAVGILYGKRELLEQMPPCEGGGDMIEKVTLGGSSYAQLPHKFEAGTPAIAEVIGFGAALDFVQEVGYERLYSHMELLRKYAYKGLRELDKIAFVGMSESSLISFNIPGIHPLDLATLLNCKQIAVRTGHLCSQPAMKRFGITECVRISFGLYTTMEEIDFCIEHLKNIISQVVVVF
jgi:cysteine desulfurase/selenocysteine lyase